MNKATTGAAVFVVLAAIGLFFLSSLIFMLLANVPISQYHQETLTYSSAMAIVALLSIFGGVMRSNGKKD